MENYTTNQIVAFCTTGRNDDDIARLKVKLSSMSSIEAFAVQGAISDIELDSQEALGIEVRDLVTSHILDRDPNRHSSDYSRYFDTMADAVNSLIGIRKDFPVLRESGDLRRAYLGFALAMIMADDVYAPNHLRLMVFHRLRGGVPHYRFKDDAITQLVCKYPDKWDEIARMITAHKIEHAPAIEAMLGENVFASLGAGVL